MLRWLIVIVLALTGPSALFAQSPASSQDDQARWTHAASGATFPRRFGGQAITETQDIGNQWNSALVYDGGGTAVESISIYIFRAAFPDARLWFERALPAVARSIPLQIFEAGPDTPFTAFGAAAPNGLYRVYRTQQAGPFQTTALATAQAGPWLVKIRYSSATLDGDAMAERIAALGNAIHFPDAIAPSPLSAPVADCTAPPVDGTGSPAVVNEGSLAEGVAIAVAQVRRFRLPLGRSIEWCRDTGFPADRGTLLRGVGDSQDWALLPGDSGTAVVAMTDGQAAGSAGGRSVVFAVTPAFVRIAALFDGMPPMMSAIQAAAPVLGGRSEGVLEIGSEPEPRQR